MGFRGHIIKDYKIEYGSNVGSNYRLDSILYFKPLSSKSFLNTTLESFIKPFKLSLNLYSLIKFLNRFSC